MTFLLYKKLARQLTKQPLWNIGQNDFCFSVLYFIVLFNVSFTTDSHTPDTGLIMCKSTNGAEIVKATPAGGVYVRPPSKMGLIRWPPAAAVSEEDKDTTPRTAPGKLLIDEQIQVEEQISPKLTPEVAQVKINNKIEAAKHKSNARPPPPAVYPKRQTAPAQHIKVSLCAHPLRRALIK